MRLEAKKYLVRLRLRRSVQGAPSYGRKSSGHF